MVRNHRINDPLDCRPIILLKSPRLPTMPLPLNPTVSTPLNFPLIQDGKPGACLTLFSLRESLLCGSGVLAKVRDVEMREFYTGYRLSSVTILWAELRKRSKEIYCSRNLVAPRDFYDTRRTFYASSYEILVEKSVRRIPGLKFLATCLALHCRHHVVCFPKKTFL